MMNETKDRMLRAQTEAAAAKNRADRTKQQNERRRAAKATKNLNASGTSTYTPEMRAALGRLHQLWDAEFTKKYPSVPLAQDWKGKTNGQAVFLLKKFSEADVTRAVQYMINFWDKLRPRFKTGGLYPTLGFLLAIADTIVPEAPMMSAALKARADYDKWCSENSNTTYAPPAELQKAYDDACAVLKTIGI